MKKIKLKSYDFLMISSYERIVDGNFFDTNYKPYTREFFLKILNHLEINEMYEECQILSDIIESRFSHDLNYKKLIPNNMKYVEELKPILSLPENFLEQLNSFFINSNLSNAERINLVEIIQKNLVTVISK